MPYIAFRLIKIKEYVDANDPGAAMIPFSADFELNYVGMSEEEKEKFAIENPGVHSQLPKIIKTGYSTLQLIYFFTAGKDEVKAWTIQVCKFSSIKWHAFQSHK